jgi:hypothetical protein
MKPHVTGKDYYKQRSKKFTTEQGEFTERVYSYLGLMVTVPNIRNLSARLVFHQVFLDDFVQAARTRECKAKVTDSGVFLGYKAKGFHCASKQARGYHG